jgi:hypothetical protein
MAKTTTTMGTAIATRVIPLPSAPGGPTGALVSLGVLGGVALDVGVIVSLGVLDVVAPDVGVIVSLGVLDGVAHDVGGWDGVALAGADSVER